MRPEDALKILDQATSVARLQRMNHIQVQEALEVLRRLVQGGEEDIVERKGVQSSEEIDS